MAPKEPELGDSDDFEARGASTSQPTGNDAWRQLISGYVEDAVNWADQHRSALRTGGLLACLGGLTFLLHTGTIPGWRRYTDLTHLPKRIVQSHGPLLPVVLTSVESNGSLVSMKAVHVPFIHRLLARYRRIPPQLWAQTIAQQGQALNCHLAGIMDVQEAGWKLLRQLPSSSIHKLRLLSLTRAAEQSWTSSTAKPVIAGHIAASADAIEKSAGKERDMPLASLRNRVEQQPACHIGGALNPEDHLLLWGELWAREPRSGIASLIQWRRSDICELLLRQGNAVMMQPIDLEWLGVTFVRAHQLDVAESTAAGAGMGVWARKRRTMREWSVDLWERAQHGVRSQMNQATQSLISGITKQHEAAKKGLTELGSSVAVPRSLPWSWNKRGAFSELSRTTQGSDGPVAGQDQLVQGIEGETSTAFRTQGTEQSKPPMDFATRSGLEPEDNTKEADTKSRPNEESTKQGRTGTFVSRLLGLSKAWTNDDSPIKKGATWLSRIIGR